jgi:hypothetical protein
MTRKDYILIAAALKHARPVSDEPYIIAEHDRVADYVSVALGTDNPRFNPERFLAACGVQTSEQIGEVFRTAMRKGSFLDGTKS